MRFEDLIGRDTRANQPAATVVSAGALYYVTDEQVTERSNGAAWQDVTGGGGGGTVVQVVNTQTGASATGTTPIPVDDSIPQIGEGNEFMTLAFTPTDAANKLRIDVVFNGGFSAATTWMIAALFQDAIANALGCGSALMETASSINTIAFTVYMTAGTTSPITFRVRGGGHQAGTTTFNGTSFAGGRLFGGVFLSSITITEIVP